MNLDYFSEKERRAAARLRRTIFAGKRALKLEEESYRELLRRETGRDSLAGNPPLWVLIRVVDALKRLGFAPPAPASTPYHPKIRAMLLDMKLPEAYADTILARQTRKPTARLRYTTDGKALDALIAALETKQQAMLKAARDEVVFLLQQQGRDAAWAEATARYYDPKGRGWDRSLKSLAIVKAALQRARSR